jgi:hypothetical protein
VGRTFDAIGEDDQVIIHILSIFAQSESLIVGTKERELVASFCTKKKKSEKNQASSLPAEMRMFDLGTYHEGNQRSVSSCFAGRQSPREP